MTITQLLAEIAHKTDLSTDDGEDDLASIEYAITQAGQAACEWTDWWWLRGQGDFDTEASTRSYALRTVNEASMSTLWAVTRLYHDDDHALTPITFSRYNDLYRLNDTSGTPTMYAVTGDPPTLYLYPTPNAANTVYVDYVKYQADVEDDSDDGLLIVPSPFHYRVYVNGAIYLLNNGVGDPGALKDSPNFVRAMEAMGKVNPELYAEGHTINRHRDARGGLWPQDQRVIYDGYSTLFINDPSL